MVSENLFQTWNTEKLNKKVLKLQKKMLKKNPYLKYNFFNDIDMNNSVEQNFDLNIIRNFTKIKHIVAKSDFWRYLMLYKFGGIYLDIDSLIIGKLDQNLIEKNSGIITFEPNNKYFLQWSLIYDKNHPVLEKCIENIIHNMDKQLYKHDIHSLTGPKLYTKSVIEILKENSIEFEDLINFETNNQFMKIDLGKYLLKLIPSGNYDKYFLFKHKYTHLLSNTQKGSSNPQHWTETQKYINVY